MVGPRKNDFPTFLRAPKVGASAFGAQRRTELDRHTESTILGLVILISDRQLLGTVVEGREYGKAANGGRS